MQTGGPGLEAVCGVCGQAQECLAVPRAPERRYPEQGKNGRLFTGSCLRAETQASPSVRRHPHTDNYSSCCVVGTVLGPWDTSVDKTKMPR